MVTFHIVSDKIGKEEQDLTEVSKKCFQKAATEFSHCQTWSYNLDLPTRCFCIVFMFPVFQLRNAKEENGSDSTTNRAFAFHVDDLNSVPGTP